ncbi:MAG TPA: hypothetical protein VE844_19155, partial [Gammaproteobacteria bacterium]|nr:hypothetical protein [Gammaproteobacteria bacterium]
MADTQDHGSLFEPMSYKLPEAVRPERYEMRLTPDLNVFTFAGEETVAVAVREPVNEMVLNAIELTIHTAAIISSEGETLPGIATLDEPNERAVLRFPKRLKPGPWKLYLTFSGILNDKLHGFYRSTYQDPSGRDRILACTQFE